MPRDRRPERAEERRISLLQVFLGQFKSLIIWILIVVATSFGLQVWSQHNATLGPFLKTSSMPLADCFLLLAAGAILLLTLEMVKVVRRARRRSKRDEPLCQE